MRAFFKLTTTQTKLFLREPMSVFFALAFGPVMLLLLGLIFGNDPDPLFGGRGYLDMSIPAYTGMIIGISALTALPITIATRREKGVLRRFSATPLRPLTYVSVEVLINLAMTLLGFLLLLAVGMLIYNVRFEGHLLNVLAGALLGALTFFAIGYALAGVVRTARAAAVIGNIIVFPMVILSGASVPLEVMPETVRSVSRFLPLTHVVALLRGLWFAEGWRDYLPEVAVLLSVLVAGTIIAVLTFHWE